MCNGSSKVEGIPHIVDRLGRKQLPIGIESFEDVLSAFTYVDKTLSLCDLIDRRGVTLYCRPRRFGKSTFLRMLQCFFELPVEGHVEDHRELFADLAIASADPYYMEACGAHPVIYLNLAACGGETYEEEVSRIAHAIGREYARHRYLYDPERLFPGELERFERFATAKASEDELGTSLAWLSSMLSDYHGNAKTVILIDEYDTPVNDAHVGGFRSKILDFYRSWLSNALKGTTSLYAAVLTGVLRVSQESIFSELNNVRFDTTLDDDHAEAIGFTADEAGALARYLGREANIPEMREWYDGYRFGSTEIYNPWSVLNYLYGGHAQPYWTNTSRNRIVTDLVARAGERQTVELAELASGGSVAKALDLRTVFDDLSANPEAVWSQLYQAGYVTTADTGLPNDDTMLRRLYIPNHEVRRLYEHDLLARAARLAGTQEQLAALHRAIAASDAEAATAVLRRILLDSPSYHDLVDERAYHVLMLALLYALPGYRPATSNRESGDGRADILIEPLRENAGSLSAIAMELKLVKDADDEDTLASAARDVALAQAERLEYGEGLAGNGLVRWGVAFCGKRVACICKLA